MPPDPDADLHRSPAAPAPSASPGPTTHRLWQPGRIRRTTFILIGCLALVPLAPNAVGAEKARSAASAVAPPIDLPTRKGTITPADLAGKLVYVDFWASWCGPCRLSFPWLKTMHDKYGPSGLVIVAVNLDKTQADADKFLANFSAPFVVAYDPEGKTAEAFDVEGMPSSFLVSPTGAIVYSHVGFDLKEAARIESVIKEALTK